MMEDSAAGVATGQPHEHPVDPRLVAPARARGISAEDAGRLAGTLSLFADPVRARILDALDLVEQLCVGDLALALRVSEDSVGYALRLLRTAGLVNAREQGRVVFYRVAEGSPEPLLELCLRALVALTRRPDPPSNAMSDAVSADLAGTAGPATGRRA